MDEADGKVSGEGSIFLLLLNEESSVANSGLDGKSRLHVAWEYDGKSDFYNNDTILIVQQFSDSSGRIVCRFYPYLLLAICSYHDMLSRQ